MADDTRWLVRRVLVLKYSVFIVVLSALSYWLYKDASDPLSTVEIAKGFFYSVVSALILSLIYDVFTRREARILNTQEKNELHHSLEQRFLTKIDLDKLHDSEIESLSSILVSNERGMRTIATSLIGDQGESFYATFLKPLVERRALYNVYVKNRLSIIDGETECYQLEFVQTFEAPKKKRDFIVLFSCDNELFNDLVAADIEIDAMVGTSLTEWLDIDAQIEKMTLVSFRKTQATSRDATLLTSKRLAKGELESRFGNIVRDETHVRAFVFNLPRNKEGANFEFRYFVRQSLLDTYYYWFAENPMFVKQVIIDYSKMAGHIGRVSPNCILGNNRAVPHHDKAYGTYTVEIDGLVWPGQGAILVWRSKSAEDRGA